MKFNSIVSELILSEMKRYVEKIPDENIKNVCDKYCEQVVPELVEQLHYTEPDFSILNTVAQQQLKDEVNKLKPKINNYINEGLFVILQKVADKIPDEKGKAILQEQVYQLASSGIQSFVNEESMDAAISTIREKAKAQAVQYADNAGHYAVEQIRAKLPDNKFTSTVCDDIDGIVQQIIQSVAAGDNVNTVCEIALDQAKGSLAKNSCEYINSLTSKGIREASGKLHVSGKGSRRINKRIDEAVGVLNDSLSYHITDNLTQVITGDKSGSEAAKDITVGTAKETAVGYMERYGAELAAEAIDSITKNVAKKITNETAKNAILISGAKIANANTITAIAGGVIDIGKSIKSYMDGDISKAQMLRNIGEQGSNVCLSTVYGTIGAAVGGPIGAAVVSMVGYMASSMLYGAVLSQFDKEDIARERAAQTHAFCEAAIAEMTRQRLLFEKQAAEFLKRRAQAVIEGFAVIDQAIISSDFNELSKGLNTITKSFGRELQFITFEEFDDFMNSDESFQL